MNQHLGQFMKTNFLKALLLGSVFASAFAAGVSTLEDRSKMITEATKLNTEEMLNAINNQQQENKIADDKSADAKNYVVVIKKEDDGSYTRVAHYQKNKVGTKIEESLMEVLKEVAKKFEENTQVTSIYHHFKIADTDYHAVITKKDTLFIFNISHSEEEAKRAASTLPREEKK